MVIEYDREVHCVDALQWLSSFENENFPQGSSIFTSIPDISEIPEMFSGGPTLKVQEYESWFEEVVYLVLSKIQYGSYAIFLQSDVRVCDNNGNLACWIDKSALCNRAAVRLGNCRLMWHKMCLLPNAATKRSLGRPSYSHFVCYVKTLPTPPIETKWFPNMFPRYELEEFPTPDIFARGEMVWPKGIGLNTAIMGCAFLKKIAKADIVVDPFCGMGTVLAVANFYGMKSIGVDISPKRCKTSLALNLSKQLLAFSNASLSSLGALGIPTFPLEVTEDATVDQEHTLRNTDPIEIDSGDN